MFAHNRPPLLTCNNGRAVEIRFSKHENGRHVSDVEESEWKVLDFVAKSTSSRNFYNLVGCARMREEPEETVVTRWRNGAPAAVDETYRESMHLGYFHMLPVLSLEDVSYYLAIRTLFSKVPNSVGT